FLARDQLRSNSDRHYGRDCTGDNERAAGRAREVGCQFRRVARFLRSIHTDEDPLHLIRSRGRRDATPLEPIEIHEACRRSPPGARVPGDTGRESCAWFGVVAHLEREWWVGTESYL